MTTEDPNQIDSPHPTGEPSPHDPFERGYQAVPTGPKEIHAVLRLLIFVALFLLFSTVTQVGLFLMPAARGWLQPLLRGVITPGGQVFMESFQVISLILAALVMALIEKRTFADYGWPIRQAFGKRLWQGLPFGFAMVSLLIALIAALHGFSLGGIAVNSADALKDGSLYALGFVLVGTFEEFSFRGYMQATLGAAIGFWPAAIALSIAFGAIHLWNPGEGWLGALMVAGFGIVAALSLKRTGSIWFAIGMHAAFDWGETFFYSVPDSGLVAQGHLLNSALQGPRWLTGGTVGPEGSLFSFAVLVIAAAGIHLLFPARQSAS